MKASLPVESVRERDIDFLLVEEFLSSKEFVAFFTNTLSLPRCDTLTKVERSVNDFGLGETDVLIEYQSGASKICILIENKLDALFQPQQAERYIARAAEHVRKGAYAEVHIVLVAPKQYIDRQNDFSLCLSYEQIMEYFAASNLKSRGAFKIQLLRIAAEKLRRGYVAVNSEANQAFWHDYREQLMARNPLVAMKPVSVVPARSDWISLTIGKHTLVHKLEKGYLDFAKPEIETIAKFNTAFNGATEHLTFKSGDVLRVHTTPIDRFTPLQNQLDQFEQCMKDLQTATALIQSVGADF